MRLLKRHPSPDRVFFTATTGRTGTTTLAELFRLNVPDCIAEHEPEWHPQGFIERIARRFPSHLGDLERRGFGHALRWFEDDAPALNKLARLRARRIQGLPCRAYLESSHAFLSSLCDAMADAFPDLGLIHLVRDPLEVAASFCNRNTHPPESPEFLNALVAWHPHPDARKNCLRRPQGPLTALQSYLWVWIEAELRCLRFLERHPAIRCFLLDTQDLNDPDRIAALFTFFEIPRKTDQILLSPVQNSNHVETRVSDQQVAEAQSLLRRIDPEILKGLPCLYGLRDLAR